MRKTILLLLLLGLANGLYANPITPEKALQVAQKVLSAQPGTKASSGKLRVIWDGESAGTKAPAGEAPAFYVVERDGGGFVIVAGDTNVRPVLALSYTNPFSVEDMPDNVRWWMERIKSYCRSLSQESHPEALAQWEAFGQTKSTIYPEAGITNEFTDSRTVQWNQRDPANQLCPTVPGETKQSVCGCVALAMAEILTWHGYPEKGNGTVPEYVSNEGKENAYTIEAHDLGTVYKWADLKKLTTAEAFYSAAGTSVGNNLAQLVYDLGTIFQLNYSNDGTSGNISNIAALLSEYMGYSKNAIELWRHDGYPEWKWNQMLLDEVKRHPVYYSGHSYKDEANPKIQAGGHAYVLDGYATYQESTVFHFNFGWGGKCNGYYSSDYQHVKRTSDELLFDGLSALINFEKDPDNETSFFYQLSYSDVFYEHSYSSTSDRGLSGSFDGERMTIKANLVEDSGSGTFSGVLKPFRVNWKDERDAQPLKNGHAKQPWPKGKLYTFTYTFGLPEDTTFGDKFSVFYLEDGQEEYIQIGSASPSAVLLEYPAYPAAFIKKDASYKVGDYFYFKLTNHNYSFLDAVWEITDPSGSATLYTQEEDRVKLTSAGQHKIVVKIPGQESIVAFINVQN